MYDDEYFDACWGVTGKEEEVETIKTAPQLRTHNYNVFSGTCALTQKRSDNSLILKLP